MLSQLLGPTLSLMQRSSTQDELMTEDVIVTRDDTVRGDVGQSAFLAILLAVVGTRDWTVGQKGLTEGTTSPGGAQAVDGVGPAAAAPIEGLGPSQIAAALAHGGQTVGGLGPAASSIEDMGPKRPGEAGADGWPIEPLAQRDAASWTGPVGFVGRGTSPRATETGTDGRGTSPRATETGTAEPLPPTSTRTRSQTVMAGRPPQPFPARGEAGVIPSPSSEESELSAASLRAAQPGSSSPRIWRAPDSVSADPITVDAVLAGDPAQPEPAVGPSPASSVPRPYLGAGAERRPEEGAPGPHGSDPAAEADAPPIPSAPGHMMPSERGNGRASPASVEPDSSAPSLARQLGDAIGVASRTPGGSIRLQLHPQGLGSISLRVVLSGDSLSVRISVDNPLTHDLVQATWPQLAQSLDLRGLALDGVFLELAGGGGQGSGVRGRGSGAGGGRGSGVGGRETRAGPWPSETATPSGPEWAIHRVDYRL
jgi:hypothetical protein